MLKANAVYTVSLSVPADLPSSPTASSQCVT